MKVLINGRLLPAGLGSSCTPSVDRAPGSGLNSRVASHPTDPRVWSQDSMLHRTVTSPLSPSSWDSILVLSAMLFCPEPWLAVSQDAPQCGFVGSASDGPRAMRLGQEHPGRREQRDFWSCPSRCPRTPDPATSQGLPEASEHLWAQDMGARLWGLSLSFFQVSNVSESVLRTSCPTLLLGQREGRVDKGPFPGRQPHPLGPPHLGASAWLLCLLSPRPSSQSCSHSSWPDEHCPERGAEAQVMKGPAGPHGPQGPSVKLRL